MVIIMRLVAKCVAYAACAIGVVLVIATELSDNSGKAGVFLSRLVSKEITATPQESPLDRLVGDFSGSANNVNGIEQISSASSVEGSSESNADNDKHKGESMAARFARDFAGSNNVNGIKDRSGVVLKEGPDDSDVAESNEKHKRQTMASHNAMRTLKLSQKDFKNDMGFRVGRRETGDEAAVGNHESATNRRNGNNMSIKRQNDTVRKNGSSGQSQRSTNSNRINQASVNIETVNFDRRNNDSDNGQNDGNNRNGDEQNYIMVSRNGSKQGRNGSKVKNGSNGQEGTASVNTESRQDDRRNGNVNKNGNKASGTERDNTELLNINQKKRPNNANNQRSKKSNPIIGRNTGETIAETLARIQLKLRPPAKNNARQKPRKVQQLGDGRTGPAFPYRYPKIRYVPWVKLSRDTKEIVEKVLGYDEGSWDNGINMSLGSSSIESKTFSQLTKLQQNSALLLGMDENVWDCFVNHYAGYSEDDMIELGLYEHVAALSSNDSQSKKKWEQLSNIEIDSATKLCYSKEVWNGEILGTL